MSSAAYYEEYKRCKEIISVIDKAISACGKLKNSISSINDDLGSGINLMREGYLYNDKTIAEDELKSLKEMLSSMNSNTLGNLDGKLKSKKNSVASQRDRAYQNYKEALAREEQEFEG